MTSITKIHGTMNVKFLLENLILVLTPKRVLCLYLK